MSGFGSALASVLTLGLNSATLSGAIDVVVVDNEDERGYVSTPFHVRFGKLKLLRSTERRVEIFINGMKVDLDMMIGEAGEAFFVRPVDAEGEEAVRNAASGVSSPEFVESPETHATVSPLMGPDVLNLADPELSPVLIASGSINASGSAGGLGSGAFAGGAGAATGAEAAFDPSLGSPTPTPAAPAGSSSSIGVSSFALDDAPLNAPSSASPASALKPPAEAQKGSSWSWLWGRLPKRTKKAEGGAQSSALSDSMSDLADDDKNSAKDAPQAPQAPGAQGPSRPHAQAQRPAAILVEAPRTEGLADSLPPSARSRSPTSGARRGDDEGDENGVDDDERFGMASASPTPHSPRVAERDRGQQGDGEEQLSGTLQPWARESRGALGDASASGEGTAEELLDAEDLCSKAALPKIYAGTEASLQGASKDASKKDTDDQDRGDKDRDEKGRDDKGRDDKGRDVGGDGHKDHEVRSGDKGKRQGEGDESKGHGGGDEGKKNGEGNEGKDHKDRGGSVGATDGDRARRSSDKEGDEKSMMGVSPGKERDSISGTPTVAASLSPGSASEPRSRDAEAEGGGSSARVAAGVLANPPPLDKEGVSEKAVSEKTLSERALSDRGVSEKAVSEKAVSEKNASERAGSGAKDRGSGKVGAVPSRGTLKRSLFLSSEQLKALPLRPGRNKVEFSVSSLLLGTQSVEASIWLLARNCKIVISDIDGTITKSDVLGQFLPSIGKDWSQPGVASLFSHIASNGYQILYLTSRAIGQAGQTRGYIESVKQGQLSLPSGPVIMSPDRLLTSFHREVIKRTPEEFKIRALQSVRSCFPAAAMPFYAGFGNRVTDYISYRALQVPEARIFVINSKGEVLQQHRSLSYKTSYHNLKEMADAVFPATKAIEEDEFNSFRFWAKPIAVVPVQLDNSDQF